jgi:hypothetical protein
VTHREPARDLRPRAGSFMPARPSASQAVASVARERERFDIAGWARPVLLVMDASSVERRPVVIGGGAARALLFQHRRS